MSGSELDAAHDQRSMKFDFPAYCGGLVALLIVLLMVISTTNIHESQALQSAVVVLGQKAGFNVTGPWQPVPMPEYQAVPGQKMLPRSAVLMEKELETLQYFARHSKTYFEWGSGGSTELVSLFSAKKAYSIENHRPWYDEMMKREDVSTKALSVSTSTPHTTASPCRIRGRSRSVISLKIKSVSMLTTITHGTKEERLQRFGNSSIGMYSNSFYQLLKGSMSESQRVKHSVRIPGLVLP